MPILSWLTREEDIKTASQAPYRLLEEMPDLSFGERHTGNVLIQGDNLAALKALLPYYAGKVKCIYIDPPYNTRSAFLNYDDNLEHTKWLAMMWPRLELLRFDRDCKVDFIITVEALKEGWDCSFAYVLCSVANVSSATDIEQLLGRVLRMPYAKSRKEEALNRAYTHVSSPRFGEAAKALTDTLIDKMGFDQQEAAEQIHVRPATLPGIDHNPDLWSQPPMLVETVDVAPDLAGLADEVAALVQVEPQVDGTVKVTIHGDVPPELEERILATTSNSSRRDNLKAAVQRHRVAHRRSQSPAQRGEQFAVPRLFLNDQGELALVEEELLLDLGGWTLEKCPAELSETDFSIRETAERWEVDLKGEKVVYKHLDQSVQLQLGLLKLDWTDLELSRWLDKECRQPDITQPVLLEFCRKTVEYLTETRGIPLRDLLRFKYQLAKAMAQKIGQCRRQAYSDAYQHFLFGPDTTAVTSAADGFSFHARPYPASWLYSGSYQFQKHFFSQVGELDSKGEEFDWPAPLN